MKRRRFPKIRVTLSALPLCAATGLAQTSFTNTTPGSDYATPGNWSAGVPTGALEAQIATGGATRSAVYSTGTSFSTTGRLLMGYQAGSNGTLTLNPGAGTLTFGGNDFGLANYVGVDSGTATLNVNGGTLRLDSGNTGASLAIGTNSGTANGTLNVNGGTVDIVGGRLQVGLNSTTVTSTINVTSGLLSVGVAGTYAERGWFRLGAGTNTVNLDGGTFALAQFNTTAANGTRSNVYFNGGTVKAMATTTDFINGNATSANAAGANFQMKNGGLTFDTNGFDVTIADAIGQVAGQTGAFTKTGAGTLTFNAIGMGGWTGGTTVNQGTLKFGNHDTFGNAGTNGQALTANAGTTVTNGASFTTLSTLTLNSATLAVTGGANATYQAFKFTNTVTATGTSAITATTSSNAFNQIHLGGNGAPGEQIGFSTPSASDSLIIGASLRDGVTGPGGVASTGLNKLGNGTVTLSGASTYTGITTVSAGTLLVTGSLASSAVNVSANAEFGGTGDLSGSLAFDGGSFFSIANVNDPLAVTGAVTFGSGFGVDNLTDWDLSQAANGTYTLISGSNIDFANLDNVGLANAYALAGGRKAYFQTGSLQLVIVPEPASLALAAMAGLGLMRRRRA